MKDGCHGLPPSRAKGGHTPGTSPDPTGNRLLLGPVRYATKEPTGKFSPGTAQKQGGAGEYPAGQRLAPDIGHRVDTEQEAKELSLCIGGQ